MNNKELRELYIDCLEGDYYLELVESSEDNNFEKNILKERLIENNMKEDVDFFIYKTDGNTAIILKFSSAMIDKIA